MIAELDTKEYARYLTESVISDHKAMAQGDDESAMEKTELEVEVAYFEEQIKQYILDQWKTSQGQMSEWRQRTDRYWQMYLNEFIAPNDTDSRFKQANVARLNRIINLLWANMSALLIEDKARLEFFKLQPELESIFDDAIEQAVEYADLAEAGVRNCLIKSHWIRDFLMSLYDHFVTGNMIHIATWEMTKKHSARKIANPDYDPTPGAVNVTYAPDGSAIPIQRFKYSYEEVVEYDMPKMRYLNPLNVYPSELDRNNISECSNVIIYDTTSLSQLQEGEIYTDPATGHTCGIYANLDKLKDREHQNFAPEVDDVKSSRTPTEDRNASLNSASSPNTRKMRRITFIGELDKQHIFGERTISPEAWEQIIQKWNIDPEKADNWQTWVAELVIDTNEMVRCQPVPYAKDEKPVIHHKLFSKPNRTMGEGIYKLDEWDERIYNFFNRLLMEATERTARPPIGIMKSAMDPKWLLMHGDRYKAKPDEIVKLRENAKITDAIQPFPYSERPLAAIQNQMLDRERTMDMQAMMPNVKQGMASGGNTATEISAMANNSSLLLSEIASAVEVGFLEKTISWILLLFNQYDETDRIVSSYDDAGLLKNLQVPADVWLNQYSVQIVSGMTTQRREVLQMGYKEFFASAYPTGHLNVKEAIKRWGKLLHIRDMEKLVVDPPPNKEEPPRASISVTAKMEFLPPEIQSQILQQGGYVVDPATQMQQMDPNAQAAGADGQPAEGSAGMPGAEQFRDHHAANEVENRQRGLHDEQGVERSMAQKNRNPANSRRAQG